MIRSTVRTLIAILLFALPLSAATFTSNAPHTTNNDDSCDIGLYPAATLLVPYFEVDINGAPGSGQTTIITVTNTSHLPQAFAMTLWTDYGYPVLTFPFYLTGYDVQSINLFDVIFRGRIAPNDGTGSDVSPVGDLSGTSPTDAFDNPQLNEASCVDIPIQLPFFFIQRMKDAFTAGKFAAIGPTPACEKIGGVHQNAVGYATIDNVVACGPKLPIESAYFSAQLGYENVLIGDYLQVDGNNDYAQGSPAVHIRAIPEGGNPSTRKPTNLSRTFYSHLQPAASATLDNRQPLPSTFAARWIEGGAGGFNTFYKIWREVETPPGAACSAYTPNGALPIVEVVRFDEEENPETFFDDYFPPLGPQGLPATSLLGITRTDVIPANTTGSVGGWIYWNLHDGTGDSALQNWVVTSMRAENRFSADMDAVALGNGCSPAAATSNAVVPGQPPIGPAPNTTP